MSGRFRSVKGSTTWRMPPRPMVITSAVLTSLLTFLFFIDLRFRPLVTSAARAIVMRTASEVLNQAMTEQIAHEADFEKVVHVERAKDGELNAAHFDFAAVTNLQSAATERAEAELADLEQETLRLPLSQVVGGSLFSSLGPAIPIHLHILGSVHSSVEVSTQSVGINQTVHMLLLNLTADMSVITPFVGTPVTVHSQVPIAYVVLSGKVPNTYMQNQGGSSGAAGTAGSSLNGGTANNGASGAGSARSTNSATGH